MKDENEKSMYDEMSAEQVDQLYSEYCAELAEKNSKIYNGVTNISNQHKTNERVAQNGEAAGMTKSEIIAIKDRAKRRKAIAENMELFTDYYKPTHDDYIHGRYPKGF